MRTYSIFAGRVLWISNNEIQTLPASFQRLRLEDIDVYGNPFQQTERVERTDENRAAKIASTLLATAAKIVILAK